MHRKAHYNEFKMAQLLKSQLRDDDDDEDQDDNDEKEAEDKNTKNVNKQEVAVVEKDDEKGNEDHQMESS